MSMPLKKNATRQKQKAKKLFITRICKKIIFVFASHERTKNG